MQAMLPAWDHVSYKHQYRCEPWLYMVSYLSLQAYIIKSSPSFLWLWIAWRHEYQCDCYSNRQKIASSGVLPVREYFPLYRWLGVLHASWPQTSHRHHCLLCSFAGFSSLPGGCSLLMPSEQLHNTTILIFSLLPIPIVTASMLISLRYYLNYYSYACFQGNQLMPKPAWNF